jgi:DNA-binding MarR family transcriptional regulator
MTPASTARQLSKDADDALRVTRALVAVATRSLSQADEVTMPQFRALVILTSRGPTTAGELANHLHVHQSTLTRMADRLVRKKLVRRFRVEGDRREVSIEVTKTGVALVEAVSAARRRELAAILRRIPEPRRRCVIDAFQEFADAAGEPPEDEWFTVLDLASRRPSASQGD